MHYVLHLHRNYISLNQLYNNTLKQEVKMNWTFPCICIPKTEEQQIEKVAEEIEEFILEHDQHAKDLEALDVYHAAETLLRIRFKDRENELDAIVKKVIEKNRARGKYF